VKGPLDWLRERRLIEHVSIAVIAVVIGGAILSAFNKLDLSTGIPLWIVIPVAVIFAGIGYRAAMPTFDPPNKAEHDALRRERDQLHNRLKQLEHLLVYIRHLRDVVGGFAKNKMSLVRFPEDPKGHLKKALCELPSQLIQRATGDPVGVSVWIEGAGAGHERCFEVVLSTGHNEEETNQFNRIPVEGSWLAHAKPHCLTSEGSPVFGISPLAKYLDGSPDPRVFRELGYESVQAVPVEIGGRTVRVVALSREPDTFDDQEETYLFFLWCALMIATHQTLITGESSSERT
jgi:hypothetical protein